MSMEGFTHKELPFVRQNSVKFFLGTLSCKKQIAAAHRRDLLKNSRSPTRLLTRQYYFMKQVFYVHILFEETLNGLLLI